LTTSQLARRADVNKQTVRYYERRGLLPEPPRNGAGHRQYDGEAVRRLYFIKRAQELGFSLDAIDELLSLRARPDAANREVKRKTKAQLDETRARLADLRGIASTLEDLYEACDGEGTTSECPILDALAVPPEDGERSD
jgi:Hg(II)-responsive transcriptional regulator